VGHRGTNCGLSEVQIVGYVTFIEVQIVGY